MTLWVVKGRWWRRTEQDDVALEGEEEVEGLEAAGEGAVRAAVGQHQHAPLGHVLAAALVDGHHLEALELALH